MTKGGSPAILIGFGKAGPPGKGGMAEQDDDQSPGAMAGEAFADAVKSGDGQAVYDAFETLYRECQHGSSKESSDDMDMGDEGG